MVQLSGQDWHTRCHSKMHTTHGCAPHMIGQLDSSVLIAVCKDNYVVYACGFDRNGKWEWFCESKWRCKNDAAKMTLQKWSEP